MKFPMNPDVPPRAHFINPPPKEEKSSMSRIDSSNPRKSHSPQIHPVKRPGCRWVTVSEALDAKRVREQSGEAWSSLFQINEIPLPEEMAPTRVEQAQSTEPSAPESVVSSSSTPFQQPQPDSNEKGFIEKSELLPEEEMETEKNRNETQNGKAIVNELSQVSNIFQLTKEFLRLLAKHCGRTVIPTSEQDDNNLWSVSVSFSTIPLSFFAGCAIDEDETVAELRAYNFLLERLADDRIVPREFVSFIQRDANWGPPLAEQIALLLNLVSEAYATNPNAMGAPETIHKAIYEYSSRYWRKTVLVLPAEIELPERPEDAENWVVLVRAPPPVVEQPQVARASSIPPSMPAHLQGFPGNNGPPSSGSKPAAPVPESAAAMNDPSTSGQTAQKPSTTTLKNSKFVDELASGLNERQSKVSPIFISLEPLPGYAMIRDPRLAPNRREQRAVLPILRSDLRAPIEYNQSSRNPANDFVAENSVLTAIPSHNDEVSNEVTQELPLDRVSEMYQTLVDEYCEIDTMIEENEDAMKKFLIKLAESSSKRKILIKAQDKIWERIREMISETEDLND